MNRVLVAPCAIEVVLCRAADEEATVVCNIDRRNCRIRVETWPRLNCSFLLNGRAGCCKRVGAASERSNSEGSVRRVVVLVASCCVLLMDVLRFEELLRACIRCGVKVGADDLQASTDGRGRRWHTCIFRARK